MSSRSVSSGSLTRREYPFRDYKSGGVGAEVLEKVGKTIKEDECGFGRGPWRDHGIVSKTCQISLHKHLFYVFRSCSRSPMHKRIMGNMVKPINWIGFLPHESIK